MTRLYDISRAMHAAMAVWPGDPAFELNRTGRIADGLAVNVSSLAMGAHTGTHVDAPYHFEDDAPTLDKVDLSVYWGPAQVVTVSKAAGPLTPADFAGYDLGRVPRLLVHSPNSEADPNVFPDGFVHPSPELADYLGQHGIVLYGADAPSMDPQDSKDLAGHHALQRNNILILEGLDLSGVPDGVYELVALPLKLIDGDGSPVRAVLRALE
jgi:arylformamidase